MTYTLKLVKKVKQEGDDKVALNLPTNEKGVLNFLKDAEEDKGYKFHVKIVGVTDVSEGTKSLVRSLELSLDSLYNELKVNHLAKYIQEKCKTITDIAEVVGVLKHLSYRDVGYATELKETLHECTDTTIEEVVLTITGAKDIDSLSDEEYSDTVCNSYALGVLGYYYSQLLEKLYTIDKELVKRGVKVDKTKQYGVLDFKDGLLHSTDGTVTTEKTYHLIKSSEKHDLPPYVLKLPASVQEIEKFLKLSTDNYAKTYRLISVEGTSYEESLEEAKKTLIEDPVEWEKANVKPYDYTTVYVEALQNTIDSKLSLLRNAYKINRMVKAIKENNLNLEEAHTFISLALTLGRSNIAYANNIFKSMEEVKDKTIDDLVLTLTGEDDLESISEDTYSMVVTNSHSLGKLGYYYDSITNKLYTLDKGVLKRPTPEQEEEYNMEVVEDTLLEGRILADETLLRYGVMDETNVTGVERLVTILRNWKYYKNDTDLLANMTVDVFKGYVEAKGFV